jgi:site-specific DNA recombinase
MDATASNKPIGIWIRVSTEDQAKGESPEHHERRARQYAELKGWTVREVYHLEGVSGKAVSDHPEARRMLADIKSGRISGLIFSKLARLARNTRELLDFADLFREHSADLISLQESIDTSTPAGRLFYTMIAAMAQWEREEIASRVAASVPIRASLGKHTGGAAPYGYAWAGKNKQLVPDEKEAPVRKLMYELYLETPRRRTVAKMLNDRGYRTRNGSLFTDTTVHRLLADPTAKGIRRANYTQSSDSKKAWKLKPESEWVQFEVPAIVSAETWDRVNALLNRGKGSRPLAGRPALQLFTGLAHCACGQKMYKPSGSKKYVCPKCKTKIALDDLEQIFQEQLKGFFFSPDEIQAYLKQTDDRIAEKEELLSVLQTEQGANAREMDRLYRLYMDDGISLDAFKQRNRALEERQQQINDELPALQADLDVIRINYLSSEEIISGAKDLYSRWHTLEHEEKRKIIETITERITISDDDIEISLNYLPSSDGRNRSEKATQPQGFIAATSWMSAG